MRRLHLSKKDRMISGVCGGIGETYDIDPTLVRLALVFLCLATAVVPVMITYIAAKFIIPSDPTG